MNEIINFLSSVELFFGLDRNELKLITDNLIREKYDEGAYLFTIGANRNAIYIIRKGDVILTDFDFQGNERKLVIFSQGDFLGEGVLSEESTHSTSARALSELTVYKIPREFFKLNGEITLKFLSNIIRVISRRMQYANSKVSHSAAQYQSGQTRSEHDLLGNMDVPIGAYFGVQTLRAVENFNISGQKLNFYPLLIDALAMVKKGAALANHELGMLDDVVCNAICRACDELLNSKYHFHFVVDMIQGGAGTSTNMNANEVIANRALELMGFNKGDYEHCHPNNHVNLSQSTNDAYPTSVKIALVNSTEKMIPALVNLINAFRIKGHEFKNVIKMGRTQLQDAVPMTLGQEFDAYAATLSEEIERLRQNANLLMEINMGATAIGTGINADPDYPETVLKHLRNITGLDLKLASNLVEATQDTGAFVIFSSAVKRLAIKLSKISNDLRLLSSGPRAGLGEINLPPMQPGSSIMPGKVNPVIPEVVNQVAFKVIGNDLTVTMAAEAGQLELNVMEPVIVQSLFESIDMLINGMNTLNYKCVSGITANEEVCRGYVANSIGLVTALNPILGYEICSDLAKVALRDNRSVYDLVLERNLMTQTELDEVLSPANMLKSKKLRKN
ncbi:MAG: aspartate ammonia-lyase [Bacteroidales bacterium]|nr:aspartate ammonia-lyase [Bacteroidales bacterium]